MRSDLTILDACRDPALFGRWFKEPETWAAWFTFLASRIYGVVYSLTHRLAGDAERACQRARESFYGD